MLKKYIIVTSIIVSLTAPLCSMGNRQQVPLTKEQLRNTPQLPPLQRVTTPNFRRAQQPPAATCSSQQDDSDDDDFYALDKQ